MSTPNTLGYYGVSNPSKFPALAIVFSVTFHAALLMALDRPWIRPPKAPVVKDLPSTITQVDLTEPPEVIDTVKTLEDPPALSAPVPMLPDNPVVTLAKDFPQEIVPVTATDLGKGLTTIPPSALHGPKTEFGKVFKPIDLDKKPEAVSRTAPTFPYELQRSVNEATVIVGFIVSSRGEVVSPHIISSTHPGFDRPALSAIEKWKFKPGIKQARKVNTQVEQTLVFTLTDEH